MQHKGGVPALGFLLQWAMSDEQEKALAQEEAKASGEGDDPFQETRSKTNAEREDEYRAQRQKRMLSPPRADAFADSTPAPELQTYKDVMIGQQLDKEKRDVLRQVQKAKEEETLQKTEG